MMMSNEARAPLALAEARRIGRFDRIEDLIGKSDRTECAGPERTGASARASEEKDHESA